MSVDHVEVIVEEPSMEVALRLLLPKMLGGTSFRVYHHQCKDELLQRLPDRLRGYASWLPKTWRIVVIVDRDDDECDKLKVKLERMASAAGLTTRTKTGGKPYAIVNRLAIEELEAWYFGDWEAVQAAYPEVAATVPSQAKYRDSDAIAGGTWEAIERLLQRSGYFTAGLRKIEIARTITPHMEPARNRSRSFQTLRATLLELAQP